MSSLQEHMERHERATARYDALELFVRSLGFSPGVVREVSVVPHTISVTLRTGPGTGTTTDLRFRPWKEAPTA